MNKFIKIIFIVLTIISLIFIFYYYKQDNFKIYNKNTKNNHLESFRNYIKCNNVNICNRTTLILNDEILIGNNKKELENGYFDVKITLKNENILLIVNKLLKNNEYQEIIDIVYLKEVVELLNKIFSIELNDNNINELVQCIRENYDMLRRNISIDTLVQTKVIKINNLNIKVDVINNMLNLIIDIKEV